MSENMPHWMLMHELEDIECLNIYLNQLCHPTTLNCFVIMMIKQRLGLYFVFQYMRQMVVGKHVTLALDA
jgi:hypothetical protein